MTQTLSQAAFDALVAEGYSRIPVTRTLLADTETPLSTYTKLCDQPYSFLFESVEAVRNGVATPLWGSRRESDLSYRATDLPHRKTNLSSYEVDDPLAEVERLHESTNSAPLDSLPYSTVDGLAIFV